MADDSLEVKEYMEYHPTDTPRGMLYYELDELTTEQQTKLNVLKINTVREDEKYLAAHPEIRAIIVLLLRYVYRHRPIIKIHEFIAKFFSRKESEISDEIDEYLASKKEHVPESTSGINVAKRRKYSVGGEIMGEEETCVCEEECVCDSPSKWPKFTAYDANYFTDTEHWLTPKSSKTSMSLDDTQHAEVTETDLNILDLAKVLEIMDVDEEGEYEGGDEGPDTTDNANVVTETNASPIPLVAPEVRFAEIIEEAEDGEAAAAAAGAAAELEDKPALEEETSGEKSDKSSFTDTNEYSAPVQSGGEEGQGEVPHEQYDELFDQDIDDSSDFGDQFT